MFGKTEKDLRARIAQLEQDNAELRRRCDTLVDALLVKSGNKPVMQPMPQPTSRVESAFAGLGLAELPDRRAVS